MTIGLYRSPRSGRVYLATREEKQVWVEIKVPGPSDPCEVGTKWQWTPYERFPSFLTPVAEPPK